MIKVRDRPTGRRQVGAVEVKVIKGKARDVVAARLLQPVPQPGFAGSAAAAILILATIATPKWAMLALGMFGIGTVAGMMLVTLLLAVPAMYAMSRFAGAQRPIMIASGVASVAFGLLLAHRVGFVEGLFRLGAL